jgi:hypothetical protein
MKKRILSAFVFVVLILIGIYSIRFALQRHAQSQWLQTTIKTLEKRGAPPANLAQTFRPEAWAGEGYILFSNRWVQFACHTFHDSEKIGDIAVVRTPDNVCYVSHYHFCISESEYYGWPQPKDFSQFLEIFGSKQGWKKVDATNSNFHR